MYLCHFAPAAEIKNTNFPVLPILPMSRLEKFLNSVQTFAGHTTAVLTLLMVCLVAYNVIMRYAFNTGSIALQEMEWYLFSAAFLLGAGYVLREEGHVRIDIFYAKFSRRTKAWVDIVGTILFLLPFSALVVYYSWSFTEYSFNIGERSNDPGGLPLTFIVKAMIPLSFILLLLAGISLILRNVTILRGKDTPGTPEGELPGGAL
jgi:TRAP-type mannitol/chloroaromatic compound transport system permease small subunit